MDRYKEVQMARARIDGIAPGTYRVIESEVRSRNETVLGDYGSVDEAEKAIRKSFATKVVTSAVCWFSYTIYNHQRKIVVTTRATKRRFLGYFTKTNILTEYY